MDKGTLSNCVLLLDLPRSALGGIDLLSFTTAPRFHGIKNLPPGLHFVFAATDASMAVRHGAWFYVSPSIGAPQVFIKKWDRSKEELVAETAQPEVMRWRANLGGIWNEGLTPYRQTVPQSSGAEDGDVFEESLDWSQLTSRITQSLLSRITGLDPDHWSLNSASSSVQDLEYIPGLDMSKSVIQAEKELRFLPIDLKRTWREGATGEELSAAAQDRSWALGELIEKHCSGYNERAREWEVVGELQFTFLMVLTLNNNSCLEQWKRILGLLFTSRQAVKERTHLFLEALKILRLQIGHSADMEAGMFDINEDGGGFLKPLLRKFRRSLDESNGQWKTNVLGELDELQDYLKEEFGWEFDENFVKRGMLELEDGERVEMDVNGVDEDEGTGEYAPTVVELTESQLSELEGGNIGSESGNHLAEEDEEDADLEDMDTRY
ncbi:A1 cistron-splicing factor [Clohesyomyces aquaticus]|uniref:A1 cistron-splicing factor n=1 Tax=Clohesyomyces aquaticus TaxID=1231657 RepID=A0A1Y1YNI3_9PLEO|nr:A1 cistron-splicing factor [Clohesyomyces aquaticus]